MAEARRLPWLTVAERALADRIVVARHVDARESGIARATASALRSVLRRGLGLSAMRQGAVPVSVECRRK
ncbi:hypothetical protein OG909_00860 [Streptomyces sp. NBC_01754]|uniref:hypothetical protein n=1 Tax=Streptomyces sp. NBC_01754 TaxID=2975930 RepID=UPI002DDC1892|nr:hypothetical protein [Streptomyces sp. NBC_01754]WSC90972.1 hypothetical protein OG909_00860 [Streptomyces sp. NBC_01754]